MSETRQADPAAAAPELPHDGAAPPPALDPRADRSRPRRVSPVATLTIVGLVLTAAGGTAYALSREGEDSGSPATPLPVATTEVTEGTLTDATTEGGTLGYGTAQDIVVRRPGTITRLPETGDVIRRGEELLEIDSESVPLLYSTEPAWRDLYEGLEGRDVRQLERNLEALGYDGFDVDDVFTDGTAQAVMEWQEDLGVDVTGVVPMDEVVLHDGPARVEAVTADLGATTGLDGGATPALSVTGTTPAAIVALDPADRRLAEVGTEVDVTLPDGSTVPATITEVATDIQEGDAAQGQDPDASTTLEVVVELGGEDARKKAGEYDAAAVDVTFTAGTRTDVLIVPVAALVALAEGGFGLEVVENGRSHYVPVDTGLFSGGRVEVSGAGIANGTVVGVPE